MFVFLFELQVVVVACVLGLALSGLLGSTLSLLVLLKAKVKVCWRAFLYLDMVGYALIYNYLFPN